MQNLTDEEFNKLAEFLNSVDGLISGKFILADIKISNILKLIARNQSLYNYIKSTLTNFNFEEELKKASTQNNNGVFKMPVDRNKVVAMVFCFLVECDAKRINYFDFIKENFAKTENASNYVNFANSFLVPFKEIIMGHFYGEEEPEEVEEQPVEKNVVNDIFSNLTVYLNQMLDNIVLERRIKSNDKETLNYIIKNIIYSMRYKDLNVVNAFIAVLDILADKYACLRLPLKDIKSELMNYYSKKGV